MLIPTINGRPIALAFAMTLFFHSPAVEAEALSGVFAIPGEEARVSGEMLVRERGPLSVDLEVVFRNAATGERIRTYTEELTQQMHLLAVDSTLSRLVHEHVKAAGPDGVLTARMQFPEAGLYHIYADSVPEGMDQQVLRFDVEVGTANSQPQDAMPPTSDERGVITASSGPYVAAVDPSSLRAGEATPVRVSILKNGEPARDLAPYLGVAAHSVLIRAEGLAYVHAHPTQANEFGAPHEHNHGMAIPTARTADQGGHSHAEAAPAPAMSGQHNHGHASADAAPPAISPEMVFHLIPPGPGRYAMFLQFLGEGGLHTLAFSFDVPAT